jgi:hypothetical protein
MGRQGPTVAMGGIDALSAARSIPDAERVGRRLRHLTNSVIAHLHNPRPRKALGPRYVHLSPGE